MTGALTGNWDIEALQRFGAQPCPASITWASDQEQLQLTGGDFIIDELRVTGVRFHDFFHRTNNDLQTSQAMSGLTPVYYANLFVYNIAYGPWQSASHFHALLSQMLVLAKLLRHDDILPMRFWPQILVDLRRQGEKADDKVGPEAREIFLKTFDVEAALSLKQMKVKPSTWMSFNQAHDSWDPQRNTRAMVMAAVCLNKGFITTAEDLFAGVNVAQFEKERKVITSKAAQVKDAKSKLQALQKKSESNLAAVAKILADEDVTYGARIIALATRAEYTYFTDVVKHLLGPESSAAFSHDWSQWSWMQPLKDTLGCLRDAPELGRCGFRVCFPSHMASFTTDSAEVKLQNARAKTLGVFVQSIVSERAGSMLIWTSQYPYMLAGLLLPGSRAETMAEFKRDVEAWWAAKET
jgi:hypothetical protein